LQRAGLTGESADRRVVTYSKGMRQKVGLAIAFAKGAQVLLLDEPTSGLDPHAAQEFNLATAAIAATGVAVLMATHDLMRAQQLARRIGVLHEGRLRIERNARDVSLAELETLYLAAVNPTASHAAPPAARSVA